MKKNNGLQSLKSIPIFKLLALLILSFLIIAQFNLKVTHAEEASGVLKSISVDSSKVTIYQGRYVNLKVYATYSDDTSNKVDISDSVSCRSSDTSIAEVDDNNIVAVSEGSTTITYYYQQKSTKVSVTVESAYSDSDSDSDEKAYPDILLITDYQMANNTLGVVQNSNKLVVGETAKITELTISKGLTEYNVNSDYTIKSLDSDIISVSDGNVLKAETEGTATILAYYRNMVKTFNINVKSQDREVSKVKIDDNSSSKVLNGTTASVAINVLDQYGDPYVSNNEAITAKGKGTIFSSEDFGNIDVDSDGNATISWQVASIGSGNIVFSDESGDVLGYIRITSVKNSQSSSYTYKILETSDSESDDLKLNVADDSDNEVTLEVGKYLNGVKSGVESLDGWKAHFSDDYIKINGQDADNSGYVNLSGTTFKVTAVQKVTSTSVILYNQNLKKILTVPVKVLNKALSNVSDSNNEVKSVTWKSVSKVTTEDTQINIYDILNVTEESDGTDGIVKGVKLEVASASTVRINSEGKIYLDFDNDGTRDTYEEIVGFAHVKVSSSSSSSNIDKIYDDVFTGLITEAGDKGKVTFYINDGSDFKKISEKSVSINVK